MTADDMANYHEHMAAWCQEQAGKDTGILGAVWTQRALEHDEAFQYWCRQANPGRETGDEG